jgi:hypothetical protein
MTDFRYDYIWWRFYQVLFPFVPAFLTEFSSVSSNVTLYIIPAWHITMTAVVLWKRPYFETLDLVMDVGYQILELLFSVFSRFSRCLNSFARLLAPFWNS